MNEPGEGCVYVDPLGDSFTVLFKGLWHGEPGFIIKRECGSIYGFPLSYWSSCIFQSPEPIAEIEIKTIEDTYGFYGMRVGTLCQAVKNVSGDLDLIVFPPQ